MGSARRIASTAGGAFAAFYIFYTAAPSTLTTANAGPGVRIGIVMLIVVAVQPFVPLLSRWMTSRQRMVTTALIAMGLGSAAMPFAAHWPGMVLLGVGFGLFVVASTAWAKETAPQQDLGKALGVYGFGSAIGGALGAPTGLYLAQTLGIHGTALAGALVALASILPTRRIDRSRRDASTGLANESSAPAGSASQPQLWGRVGLVGLGAHLLAVTIYATVLSSLSTAQDLRHAWLPVLAAFTVQSSLAAGRLIGGWAANRWTPSKVGIPALTLLALGTVGFTLSTLPAEMLAFTAVVGLASGTSQTVALTALMNRANTTAAINKASAAWNICFDLGLGLGALAISVIVTA